MLRILASVGLLMAAGLSFGHAAGNEAFAALQVARKAAPSGALISVTGERGEPQPAQWTLVFSDPQARGGVREVVVADGSVVAQRTPLTGYTGITSQPAINSSRLGFDSTAAFDVANQQAKSHRLGFHWVDYSLRAENTTGAPEWVLKLYDYMGAQVGVLKVSAESGAVITPLQAGASPRNDEETSQFQNSETGQKIGGVIGTVTGTVERTATTVKDATLRTVGTVQEVLTGERTIGPKGDE